jgi:ABC-type transport system involved in multi-copper enzyme maturation permease subunit
VSRAEPAAGDARSAVPSASAASDPAFDPGRFAGVTAIWVRELRGRMRGKRAFIFVTFYLGLLATILWLALRTTEEFGVTQTEAVSIGRAIFGGVLLVETLVVVALAPAYTAGLISAEREKQTYDLLAVTPISSLSLVIGKLLSGLSYLALVVFAAFPIACIALIYGGVEPADVIRGYIVLAAAAVGIGAIGVWCSAAMARTQTATVAAFIVTAGLVVGATAAWLALDSRAQSRGEDSPPTALLLLNPFVAQLDVICQATGEACFAEQAARPRVPEAAVLFDSGAGPAFVDQGVVIQQPQPGGDFWPIAVVVYVGIALLGIFGASQSISPTRRWRWRPRVRGHAAASSEDRVDD